MLFYLRNWGQAYTRIPRSTHSLKSLYCTRSAWTYLPFFGQPCPFRINLFFSGTVAKEHIICLRSWWENTPADWCYKQHIHQNLFLPHKHSLWYNWIYFSYVLFPVPMCVTYCGLLLVAFLDKTANTLLFPPPFPSPSTSLWYTFTCDCMNGVEWRGTHHVYSK